jgi:membrane-associated phospholipid phosphatase
MDKPKLSHLGIDLLRAQAVTEILVQPIKFATHRERPDSSNRQSFPSGHAAVTFAAATVLERHLGWKHSIWAYAIVAGPNDGAGRRRRPGDPRGVLVASAHPPATVALIFAAGIL